jgi:putative NIF3 family GTP cyclohydrolase 1 type 2
MLISAKIIDPVLDFSTGFQYDPYMVTQEKINQFLHDLLDPRSMQDYGINGIQVGTDREIKTIGFGVDASLKIIEEASETHARS